MLRSPENFLRASEHEENKSKSARKRKEGDGPIPSPFYISRFKNCRPNGSLGEASPRSTQPPGESPADRAASAAARRIFLDLRGGRACRPYGRHTLRELCGHASTHFPAGSYLRPGSARAASRKPAMWRPRQPRPRPRRRAHPQSPSRHLPMGPGATVGVSETRGP